MFLARHRCPKNRDDIEPDFPLGAMEITDEEVIIIIIIFIIILIA